MIKKRRPKLVHHIPDRPPAMFEIVEEDPTAGHYWHVTIADAILGDEPEFRCSIPKSSKHPAFTPHEVAVAGAGECNEGRGRITLTEWKRGMPMFSAIFVGNGRQVFCLWSTDATRATPVDLSAVPERFTRQHVPPSVGGTPGYSTE